MSKRRNPVSNCPFRTLMVLTLIGNFCVSFLPEAMGYKIEIGVTGPTGEDAVSEENQRTEIQLDTGLLTGSGGETGSAYASANFATGRLALKVAASNPDHNPQPGMGLAFIHIIDRLTFNLDPDLPFADVEFSMRVDGSPSCEILSFHCFTNAIISLGEVSDRALGLPLLDRKVLRGTVRVFDEQRLPMEAFLSARVETHDRMRINNPRATIRLNVPKGVSFTSESGVFLDHQPPPNEPVSRASVGSDLNGDGKADIVWRNVKTGAVAAWLMNGGRIAFSGLLGDVPSDWQIKGVGDVNDDGMSDIVWHNAESGVVAVWLLNGLSITSVGFPGSASTDWVIKGVGDIDGNGRADFIWRNTRDGAVSAWLMDGATVSAVRTIAGVPLEWQIAGMGDVNADGRGDIIWRHNSGVLAVWLMDGLNIASTGFAGGTAPEWEIAGFGDVDGNRTADLMWRNTSNGMVGVWLMNGSTIAMSGFLAGMPAEWRIAQMGDADGDGKADVIWHNRKTGQVAVWLMNGLVISSTEYPGGT